MVNTWFQLDANAESEGNNSERERYHSRMDYELLHMKNVFCLKLNNSMYGKPSNSLP